DTYAEQVALAAASAGFDTTLLASDAQVGGALRSRLADSTVAVRDLGLGQPSRAAALLERLIPTAGTQRLLRSVREYREASEVDGSVWHFNRPALALAVRGGAERVAVAAWFYPHRLWARALETWRHVGGSVPRRAMSTAKALDFYRWDQAGYRAAAR